MSIEALILHHGHRVVLERRQMVIGDLGDVQAKTVSITFADGMALYPLTMLLAPMTGELQGDVAVYVSPLSAREQKVFLDRNMSVSHMVYFNTVVPRLNDKLTFGTRVMTVRHVISPQEQGKMWQAACEEIQCP
jgi:hypothetical protein